MNEWIINNITTLTDAVRQGYTIEKKLYRVLDRNTILLGKLGEMVLPTVEIAEFYPDHAPEFKLTEEEIEEYNEKYMVFAVPVPRSEPTSEPLSSNGGDRN